MRKSSFEKNHQEFENRINRYFEFTFRLVVDPKRAIRAGSLKQELLEALLLRVVTRWERLVENDIITSLNRDSSQYGHALDLQLPKHPRRDECEAILLGTKYLDFKSAGNVKSFGRQYLVRRYNPFEALTPDLIEKIDEILVIRNLLAHDSSRAWRSYRSTMRKRHRFKRIPNPGKYLMTRNPRTGDERWAEAYLTLQKASERMLKSVAVRGR